MRTGQNKIYDEAFRDLLIDLAEICDSIDQLAKLVRVVHILYPSYDEDGRQIHEQIRKTYQHIRGNTSATRAARLNKLGYHWDDDAPWRCLDGAKGEPGPTGIA